MFSHPGDPDSHRTRPVIDQRGSASILDAAGQWDPMATKLRKNVEKRDELSVQWMYIYI